MSRFCFPHPRLFAPTRTLVLAEALFGTLALLAATAYAGPVITIETIALTGQPAPGAGGEATFSKLSSPILNEAGEVAFVGFLAGSGVTDSNDSGIWGPDGGGGTRARGS